MATMMLGIAICIIFLQYLKIGDIEKKNKKLINMLELYRRKDGSKM